jgi:Uma2 family endonuclease
VSVASAQARQWTIAEYLAMERTSLEKHEFFDGEVFAMAGASPEHNLIVSALIITLGGALRGKCRVFPSDQRLVLPTGLYTYADVTLVCGASTFNDDNPKALTNPHVIFEVLSETTERYDRGDKFASYRTLPSHREYVLVSQTAVHVEHFVRQPDDGWLMHALGKGETLRLSSGEIAIDDLYLEVDLARIAL